ncbi:hypothetical protein [Streptomyces sp. NPDC086010]|uniref:hypothetical protein n=1 Tax=Streptomyces sp. NPDC086010 TaxID=3365745 RepID=UPI0037D3EA25
MMRRRIRFAAVLVVVVLALTGFSTSSHGGRSGKSRSSGSSGGGCSNSSKSNGGYHSRDDHDDYDDTSSSSSGGSAYESATPEPTASEEPALRVVRCAGPRKGRRAGSTSSSVEIRSTATTEHLYDVVVTFVDAKGLTVDTGKADVEMKAGESRIIQVPMGSPRLASRVKRCLVTAELRY